MPKTTARRGNNEGSVFQRPNGKWTAYISCGTDANGKQLRKYFYGDSKSEVTMKMMKDMSFVMSGGKVSTLREDLETLMAQWLHLFKRAEVSSRTYSVCLANARLHIYPTLGKLHLHEVTSNTIQILLNQKLMEGLSPAVVRKIKFLLNQFFNYCYKNEFVAKNPVTDCIVRASKLHTEKREDRYKAIPLEIRDEFFSKLFEHDILGPICMCQCFAGLRIGEVLALRWKCLDFEHNEIRIDSAITQDVVFDKDDNILKRRTIISDTKTESSQRIVPMTNILKEALLRWKKDRWALQRQTGIEVLGDECIVFTNNQGKMRTYHGTKCILRRFVEKYGWEKYNIHFHMLRHTFSAMLFEARENPRVIQMLLGHASINTTMQTYNSVDRSYFKEATDNLDKKYGNKILDEYK